MGGILTHHEADWIEQARMGDRRAFESLYAAHAPRVRVYLFRSGFAPGDVDDLTQDTFLRAYRALAKYDPGKGRFASWLGTIARNCARTRWSQRAPMATVDPELADVVFLAPGGEDSPFERQEEVEAIKQCIAGLSTSLAALVRLRYVDGLSTRGIAAQTGIAESTVRMRLAEAHGALLRCMQAKGILS